MAEIGVVTAFDDLHKDVNIAVADRDKNEVKEIEHKIQNLQNQERKLVAKLNTVLSNLYLLPGYVLAVSVGVSSLLSSDPRICGLFVGVILVVLSFLAALGLSVRFAFRQLRALLSKQKAFASDRKVLYDSFKSDSGHLIGINIDAATPALTSFEMVNEELEFQALYYRKFLLIIIFFGILYATMFLVGGFCVLCYN